MKAVRSENLLMHSQMIANVTRQRHLLFNKENDYTFSVRYWFEVYI